MASPKARGASRPVTKANGGLPHPESVNWVTASLTNGVAYRKGERDCSPILPRTILSNTVPYGSRDSSADAWHRHQFFLAGLFYPCCRAKLA